MKTEKNELEERITKHEADILFNLYKEPFVNQRLLAENSGHSIGVVNKTLKWLLEHKYINEHTQLTQKSRDLFNISKPKRAIILAAGFGMRMVPINFTTPKALIQVNNERLIDRIIGQLHEVNITDITVVVGFMKDSFEYLIDEYGVNLTYAHDYARTNNIHSLLTVVDKIDNAYIVPCDIWCDHNPFRCNELYSWYMVNDMVDDASEVRINRKMELVKIGDSASGNGMIGIAYLTGDEALIVREKIKKFSSDHNYDTKFWECALYSGDRMIVNARVVHVSDVVEINTYEQLRDIDSNSNQLQSDALNTISKALNCKNDDIESIEVLKKGMTNRSFFFKVSNGDSVGKYIMRIPGEGTDKLINRKNEAEVYRAIHGKEFCDDPVYINPDNGYKITKYLNGIRPCNPEDENDLKKCMRKLRGFHEQKISVNHTFDIFDQILFYEKLWQGNTSIYQDYDQTKKNVFSLKSIIDTFDKEWCLTHIDAVPDNFLFYQTTDGDEKLQLTDWEYSGMQDPHVDIAMFCIYSMYDKKHVDRLIDIYFENNCDDNTRIKIYCYIASCGLLWSNWCEYKRNLGVEFGEYSLRQYRYAKEYYRYVKKEVGGLSVNG